ncbi:hypothetical protein VNO78_15029 [Psophocarpus tetragonolobus]|uniref:Uncharacterized protein n=1 Tax=Psophocarpus tetragonolobus TaxID=3891 RepID=A0AAN9XJ91_PSOTE
MEGQIGSICHKYFDDIEFRTLPYTEIVICKWAFGKEQNFVDGSSMGDHVITVSPEKLQERPLFQESSTTEPHLAIPIEELNASAEAAKEEKPVSDAYVENNKSS